MAEIGKCSGNIPLFSDIEEKSFDIMENPAAAFVHRFETRQNKYIYDVNTMKIVRADPVVWEIIGDFGVLSKEDIFSKYCGKYSIAEISAACDEISKTQQERNPIYSSQLPPNQCNFSHFSCLFCQKTIKYSEIYHWYQNFDCANRESIVYIGSKKLTRSIFCRAVCSDF